MDKKQLVNEFTSYRILNNFADKFKIKNIDLAILLPKVDALSQYVRKAYFLESSLLSEE